ncbi:MAG: dihydroorotate dehydrogenase [Chloroflexi bacterium AL-W]|nr:dihydroorotate dehydrogenase [Chloroflexi bacterium AL-N1]NOK65801.1 dihydroorotate dehydrogenase [Chloroflexi bacterium AL-N10]NOK74258.1 dihydroorotate dehydrogenase [Chloroflexi bacterium AL-N5]NOK80834.1 dihydroorotate dehydrogenase [Chloroflexi bacterium AL-W]NOK88516.1 dihydroorotate dehydrogenase [Chloroflexi bacterium AL-N15]
MDLAPHNPYGLAIKHPVLTAAGCFGYGVEYAHTVALAQIGAIVTRSTSLRPIRTSQRPRIIETPAGILSVGQWPNPGLNYVLNHYAPTWATWSTPVILSIVGDSPDDYATIARALEGVEGIAALELNVATVAARAKSVTKAVRAATQLPLLIKLPLLDETTFDQYVEEIIDAGADVLTLLSPPHGLHIDPHSGEQIEGWLSGPTIRSVTLRAVARTAPRVSIPIVGCGGVMSAEDAQQFFAAGAKVVQVGTALLTDAFAVTRITHDLAMLEESNRAE